jgi:hypothetical protein
MFECLKCNWEWEPRKSKVPSMCPTCKTSKIRSKDVSIVSVHDDLSKENLLMCKETLRNGCENLPNLPIRKVLGKENLRIDDKNLRKSDETLRKPYVSNDMVYIRELGVHMKPETIGRLKAWLNK